jgi:hypothetical protein
MTRPITDHDLLHFDSVLVGQLAQHLVDVICAQKALPHIPLASLEPAERERVRREAIAALRGLNHGAVEVGIWCAAQAVALEKYGKAFDSCEGWQQREARILAKVAIQAYRLHLRGYTEPYQERETLSIIQRVKARLAERRHKREAEQADEKRRLDAVIAPRSPDPIFDLAVGLARSFRDARSAAGHIVPFGKRVQ